MGKNYANAVAHAANANFPGPDKFTHVVSTNFLTLPCALRKKDENGLVYCLGLLYGLVWPANRLEGQGSGVELVVWIGSIEEPLPAKPGNKPNQKPLVSTKVNFLVLSLIYIMRKKEIVTGVHFLQRFF